MLSTELEALLRERAARAGCEPEAIAAGLVSDGLRFGWETALETEAAIRRGIEDCEAGREISLEEFDRRMREKYNIPDDVTPMSSEEAATLPGPWESWV